LSSLRPDDYLVALDEKGSPLSSVRLARFIEDRSNESIKRLIFLIGGAYGLDEEIQSRAKFQWSLSALTFPHQLVRLILAEQVYRACSIIRKEKYHHG
jgi:23S rRNA (pseudouridine1915-N3)-methyltransferase